MLSSFTVANYRGFAHFEMRQLRRVNLLVGKNNSGKTALLEGAQFLASDGDPSVLTDIARRRGEYVVGERASSRSVDISHFFHGHVLSFDNPPTFSGDNGFAPISMEVYEQEPEGSGTGTSSDGIFLRISGGSRADRDETRFAISQDGDVDFDPMRWRLRRRDQSRQLGLPPVRFISPESLDHAEFAAMWDEITITRQETDVDSAMRILDPTLESLHFLTGASRSNVGIVVGIKGQERRIPIGSMGDGIGRIAAIAATLSLTRQGYSFIDEIDTGLHYSIMPEMWKLVVEKAVRSESQIFATTHSWDCIEGLSSLFKERPHLAPSVAVHKIDPRLSHSVMFPGESVRQMVKSDIDPR
jgi:hypothetical protein